MPKKDLKPLQGKYEALLPHYTQENSATCKLGNAIEAQIVNVCQLLNEQDNKLLIEQLSQLRGQLIESTRKTRTLSLEFNSAADFLRRNQNSRDVLKPVNTMKAFIKHPMLMTRTVATLMYDKNLYQEEMVKLASVCKMQLDDLKSQINSAQALLQNIVISPEYQAAQQARLTEQLSRAELNTLKQEINAFHAEESADEQFHGFSTTLRIHPDHNADVDQVNTEMPMSEPGFYESKAIGAEQEFLGNDSNDLDQLDNYYGENYSDLNTSPPINDAAPMQLSTMSMGQEVGLNDMNVVISQPSSIRPH